MFDLTLLIRFTTCIKRVQRMLHTAFSASTFDNDANLAGAVTNGNRRQMRFRIYRKSSGCRETTLAQYSEHLICQKHLNRQAIIDRPKAHHEHFTPPSLGRSECNKQFRRIAVSLWVAAIKIFMDCLIDYLQMANTWLMDSFGAGVGEPSYLSHP
jgi:hypothetical protein